MGGIILLTLLATGSFGLLILFSIFLYELADAPRYTQVIPTPTESDDDKLIRELAETNWSLAQDLIQFEEYYLRLMGEYIKACDEADWNKALYEDAEAEINDIFGR